MKRLALALLFAVFACGSVQAQSTVRVNAQAVATCGAQSLTAGIFYPFTIDLTGTLCVASGAGGITAAVTVANGADVAEGNTADAAATAGGAGTVSAKLRLMTTQLNTIATTGHPITGTVAVTQSTSPWVVSGSGTAGTANAGVVTVQGIASMTPISVTNAPSSSSSVGITPIVSTAAESSHVLKASPGNAYSAYASNLTSTNGFLVLINATSAPADGAITPLACAPLSANGVASINYSPAPPGVFSTGIVAVVTSASTCFTKTTGTLTAFISGLVQ